MKHSEFIELLNLYLDHEISPGDAAKLEAEVQSNPARRTIYQQYCRMQKACKMVVADFQTGDDAAAPGDKNVIAFDHPTRVTPRKRTGGYYAVGAFAGMAACVAFIFVGRNREGKNEVASSPVLVQRAPAVENIEVRPRSPAATTPGPRGLVSIAPRSSALWVGDPLLLTGNTQAEAVRAAATQQADDQLAWIAAIQLTPLPQRLPTSNLHFDATMRSEERALGNRASSAARQQQPGDEMTAFRFGK